MSTSATLVTVPLRAHPCGRIGVPIVLGVGQASEGGLNVVPPLFVVQSPPDELGNERAPATRTDSSAQLGDKLVIEHYVHTHVLTLAH
jgi:hypothetical protein